MGRHGASEPGNAGSGSVAGECERAAHDGWHQRHLVGWCRGELCRAVARRWDLRKHAHKLMPHVSSRCRMGSTAVLLPDHVAEQSRVDGWGMGIDAHLISSHAYDARVRLSCTPHLPHSVESRPGKIEKRYVMDHDVYHVLGGRATHLAWMLQTKESNYVWRHAALNAALFALMMQLLILLVKNTPGERQGAAGVQIDRRVLVGEPPKLQNTNCRLSGHVCVGDCERRCIFNETVVVTSKSQSGGSLAGSKAAVARMHQAKLEQFGVSLCT